MDSSWDANAAKGANRIDARRELRAPILIHWFVNLSLYAQRVPNEPSAERSYFFRIANTCNESPVLATRIELPVGVLSNARPETLRGARKPLCRSGTGVK
jgi:hypothetical protein